MASASYEHRNARARALGYKGYYDYRVHNSGRVAPSAPVTSAMRAANRGHRSLADLEALLARGSSQIHSAAPIGVRGDDRGRWAYVSVLVIMADGSEREFVLRGKQASNASLRQLKDTLQASGVAFLGARYFGGMADSGDVAEAVTDAAAA